MEIVGAIYWGSKGVNGDLSRLGFWRRYASALKKDSSTEGHACIRVGLEVGLCVPAKVSRPAREKHI